jgi:hypothetical protein
MASGRFSSPNPNSSLTSLITPSTGGSPQRNMYGDMSSDGGEVDVPLTKETVEDIPWNSSVVVCREEQATTGVYGVGLKIDINPPNPFIVRVVNGLWDPQGRGPRPLLSGPAVASYALLSRVFDTVSLPADISHTVEVGDTLCFCNDRSVVKVRLLNPWDPAWS